MQITGITPQDFTDAVAKVSALYGDNLTAQITSVQSRTRFRARVIVKESGASTRKDGGSAPGARKSGSGRRLAASCWHAYRDVMYAIFDVNSNARIYTFMAKYKGREGFEAIYPATARQNIGSFEQPAYMPDLCECEH